MVCTVCWDYLGYGNHHHQCQDTCFLWQAMFCLNHQAEWPVCKAPVKYFCWWCFPVSWKVVWHVEWRMSPVRCRRDPSSEGTGKYVRTINREIITHSPGHYILLWGVLSLLFKYNQEQNQSQQLRSAGWCKWCWVSLTESNIWNGRKELLKSRIFYLFSTEFSVVLKESFLFPTCQFSQRKQKLFSTPVSVNT